MCVVKQHHKCMEINLRRTSTNLAEGAKLNYFYNSINYNFGMVEPPSWFDHN